jgi:hypothetical protein
MPTQPLSALDTDEVENIYIFLADALRYDTVPEGVAERGLKFKTVAHALATPQCLPTIISGRLPPKHGVTWFQHTIRQEVDTIFDIPNLNVTYSELDWPGSALHRVLGGPDEMDLRSIEEPFIVLEHNNGGHAPYPHLDASSPDEMLEDIDSTGELREHYKTSVAESTKRFDDRVEILADKGSLDNTLIIYLSDHGQFLGEHGGFFGHGLPMAPEVIYVPTVFIHPSLPPGASGAHLLKQTDIFPTIQAAIGSGEYAADGENLLETVEENRPAFSQGLMHPPPRYRETFLDPGYYAYGVWTRSGGHVFVKNSRIARLVTALYESTFSANTGAYNSHKHLIHRLNFTISHYLKNYHQYGTPEIGRNTAQSFVNSLNTEIKEERESRKLSDGTLERLSNLGYK